MRLILTKLWQIPTIITVVVGLILLLFQMILGSIPPSVQMVFFVFFIVVTGIPHGAIDH
ncbi:MAG: hypothetical protein HC817_14550 [Saprospiraceae bacterium]|nr:hypothetical protein [Saprospiraceae bacterium]